MTKNKFIILILVFLGLLKSSFAQPSSIERYVIFTFEDKYKLSQHGVTRYYWIIREDSIKSNDNLLFHIFLSDFSKNNVIDCCNGKDIDPLSVYQNTDYQLGHAFFKSLDELKQIITRNRKKLQTITKRWEYGQKELITIFATPVSGKFCSSNFDIFGQERTGYKGKVYIPYSSFAYSGEFWNSDAAKLILHDDFSKIKFDIIPY